MVESKRIFVDSNYWIALFHPKDSLHQKAGIIGQELKQQQCVLEISNFTFLEVVTVLAQHGGKQAAKEAGLFFLENPSVKIIHIDEALQEKTWRIFQDVPSKNMSFVDCSILAVMREEEIKELLTFDTTDFKKPAAKYRLRLYKNK